MHVAINTLHEAKFVRHFQQCFIVKDTPTDFSLAWGSVDNDLHSNVEQFCVTGPKTKTCISSLKETSRMPVISVTTEQTEQMLSVPTKTRSIVTHAPMFARNVAKPSRLLLY